jgi:hypothetical protein
LSLLLSTTPACHVCGASFDAAECQNHFHGSSLAGNGNGLIIFDGNPVVIVGSIILSLRAEAFQKPRQPTNFSFRNHSFFRLGGIKYHALVLEHDFYKFQVKKSKF